MESGTGPLIHPDDRGRANRAWRAAKASREQYEIEYRIRDRNGEFRWQTFRIRPVKDDFGTFYGWTSASVDVHEITELRGQLEDTVKQLAEAIEAKDEVFGLISHELRTPLTTILGNATHLVKHSDSITLEVIQQLANDLQSDALRLHAVIENMLVLSRTRSGDAKLETEPARLNRLAEESIRNFAARHADRPVNLDSPDRVALVAANHGYYDQVLSNLLSNAHKYSPAGLPITVQLRERADSIETVVIDAGSGIPPEQLEQVFDPFVRLRTHSGVTGLGLGLTLCKRLVELHGGSIGVRNAPSGRMRILVHHPDRGILRRGLSGPARAPSARLPRHQANSRSKSFAIVNFSRAIPIYVRY